MWYVAAATGARAGVAQPFDVEIEKAQLPDAIKLPLAEELEMHNWKHALMIFVIALVAIWARNRFSVIQSITG